MLFLIGRNIEPQILRPNTKIHYIVVVNLMLTGQKLSKVSNSICRGRFIVIKSSCLAPALGVTKLLWNQLCSDT
jgi:hypothetical protein